MGSHDIDQMCLMDVNSGNMKMFEYDLRKSNRTLICNDFDLVIGSGNRKVIICHNLPEVLPVLKKAGLNFGNVAGFASLQWCLPLEEIKELPGKPYWRDVVGKWMTRALAKAPEDAEELSLASVEAMRGMPHVTFPLDFHNFGRLEMKCWVLNFLLN